MSISALSQILQGLGAGMDFIGTPSQTLGSASDWTNINADQTAAYTDLLNQLQASSQQSTDQYAGQAAGNYSNMLSQGQVGMSQGQATASQGQNVLNNATGSLSGLQSQLANQAAYDPNSATALFQKNTPVYQQLAQQAQQQAMSAYETPASTLAALQSSANVSSAANQFAGMGGATSGAAAAAAAQGAMTPLTELAANRAATGTSAYQNTLNPLLQQGMSQAGQSSQMAYQSGIDNILSQLSAAAQQGQLGASQMSAGNQQSANAQSMYGQGASGQAGLSSLYAGLQGAALGGLGQVSESQWYAPTVSQATGLQAWL